DHGEAEVRPLTALEHATALVVRYDLVEESLLRSPVVQVVAPDALAEGLAGELALLPQVDRLAKGRRERLGLCLGIGVPDELGARVGPLLEPVEPGREQRRVAEIGIDVGAGDPAFDPPRLPMAHDPEPAGAVVAAPGDRGRGPAL